MRKYTFLLSLVLFGSNAFAEIRVEDITKIHKKTESGQYQEALDDFIEIHKKTRYSAKHAGIFLIYELDEWLKLGEKYPPAIEALKGIRDGSKKKLESGKGTLFDFNQVSSINKRLNEDGDTVALFLALDKSHPKQAGQYFQLAKDSLFQHKEYRTYLKYINDPIIEYQQLEKELKNTRAAVSISNKQSDAEKSKTLAYENTAFKEGVTRLVTALIATGQKEKAIKIKNAATSFFPQTDMSQKLENLIQDNKAN
jgi:hypothetical protein